VQKSYKGASKMNTKLSPAFIPRDYNIFCGMDVDKKSISATFLNHDGEMKSIKTSYSAQNLMNYVNNHYPGQKVVYAYEAGPTGYGLYDGLTGKGNSCLIVSPASIPSAGNERVKTNRLDSKKIAENLRGGQLKSINVPTEAYRQLRHLTQLRDTFVKQATATKLRIKSLLLFEGIEFPRSRYSNQEWTINIKKQLREIACSETVRFKLDSLLDNLEYNHYNVLETSKYIRQFCKKNDEIRRNMEYLQSIPGIGSATSSQLLGRIGDWRQLTHPNQIGAFLGLVPSENSTGDDINRGSITRLGDRRLRNKLVQCAWICIRRDKELMEFYQRIYKNHNKKYAAKIAIVAVARKLTTRIFAVLKEQRKYEIRKQFSLKKEVSSLPVERLVERQTRSLDSVL
jgi:transposase